MGGRLVVLMRPVTLCVLCGKVFSVFSLVSSARGCEVEQRTIVNGTLASSVSHLNRCVAVPTGTVLLSGSNLGSRRGQLE